VVMCGNGATIYPADRTGLFVAVPMTAVRTACAWASCTTASRIASTATSASASVGTGKKRRAPFFTMNN